jgi:hypothetical protein
MYLIFGVIGVCVVWLQYQMFRLSSEYDRMAFREYARERRLGSLAIRMSRVERHLIHFPVPEQNDEEVGGAE